jgi:hypothetical protein
MLKIYQESVCSRLANNWVWGNDIQPRNKASQTLSLFSKPLPHFDCQFSMFVSELLSRLSFRFHPFLPNAESFPNSHASLFSSQLFSLLSLIRFRLCFVFAVSVQQAFEDLAKSFVGDWLLSHSVCLFSIQFADSPFVRNRRSLTCFFQVSFFFAD